MFGEIGIEKLLLLFGIVLLLFGARRLPEVGASMGHGIRAFRRSVSDARDALEGGPPPEREPPGDVPRERAERADPRGDDDGPRRLLDG